MAADASLRRRITLAVGAVLLPVLAACSSPGSAAAPTGPPLPAPSATLLPTGSASPSASAVSIDPCTLADAAQVRQATGGTVGSPVLDLTDPAVPGCSWPVTGSHLGDGNLLVVVTATAGSAATFASVKAAFPGAQDVDGVGAAAFFSGDIGQLLLLQHGTTVTLAASGFVLHGADPDAAAVRSVLTELGRDVAAQL